jgi:hypothetical protein
MVPLGAGVAPVVGAPFRSRAGSFGAIWAKAALFRPRAAANAVTNAALRIVIPIPPRRSRKRA